MAYAAQSKLRTHVVVGLAQQQESGTLGAVVREGSSSWVQHGPGQRAQGLLHLRCRATLLQQWMGGSRKACETLLSNGIAVHVQQEPPAWEDQKVHITNLPQGVGLDWLVVVLAPLLHKAGLP